ncbi:MAG: rhomboid family intramembrane serine protease [Saccharospirillaceae bacterium]|nr:rhomboid family intramembrane serine protease [Pseudomonadales bacterium]NRB80178.1 rhomboid family intramembrane serine protease [Saccharospirillaceae bacterium]
MKQIIKKYFPINLLGFVAVIWLVFIVNFIVPFFDFNDLGIKPRTVSGLLGVFASVFLHGGLGHILANTFGLLICGGILRLSYSKSQLLIIIILGTLVSGLLTWLISSPAIVIGASGLVFCFISMLLANAFFKPSILTWAQALLCLFFYSGALLSLLVVQQGISWAGHFSGVVAGVLLSLLFNKYPKLFK